MGIDIEKHTLKLRNWSTPATSYPEARNGNYRIHHGRYIKGTYNMHGIDDYLFFEAIQPLTITTLQERRDKKWCGWMIDDPPHFRSMEIYAEESKGEVLTTGLGLGLVVPGLVRNQQVEKIVVVERSPEVISLVLPYLPKSSKLTIVEADFYDYLKYDQNEWDTIIIDLWVTHSVEEKLAILHHYILPLIPRLKLKYPGASITFHGFYSVSDIKYASRDMVDLVLRLKEC